MRYDLPKQRSASSSGLSRTLLVWGLPIVGWAVLVLIFIIFLAPGNPAEAPSIQEPVTKTPPEQTPEAPQQPSAAPAPQTQTPSTVAAPANPARPTLALPSADYDFSSAVTTIGLPKETGCATGILVDPVTRKVLWAKSADKAVPIASMTKMMTMLLAEEDLASGIVSRDTIIPVSRAAHEIGGSQVWLDPRESFPLQELLKAVAIKSANDAAYLVGEYLGRGDIGAFVARMNKRAKELGMKHTQFYETHGLGDSQKRNNTASAHDMILLGEALLAFPNAMELAGTRMETFRNGKLELKNHNNLVFNRVPGVDGLKTGYTNASGFCVTISCKRNGRRLLGCVTGYKSAKERDAFCRALLDWGYTK